MKAKPFDVRHSIIIFMSILCVSLAYSQNPVRKPQRPAQTEQTKPKETKPKQSHRQQQRSTPQFEQSRPQQNQQTAPQTQPTQSQQTQTNQLIISGTIAGHDYVDLGLSVKWSTCNIGASSPSDYGDYYAWGETSVKTRYEPANSKWYGDELGSLKAQGVVDSNGNLMPTYDAARQKWGESWRMPTLGEIKELVDKCWWEWTAERGKSGYRVTGPNGNSIFIPAAGYRISSDHDYVGHYGYCWSATVGRDIYFAYDLYFFSTNHYPYDSGSRYYGLSVRPVTE